MITTEILSSPNLINIWFLILSCYTANSLFKKAMKIRQHRLMYAQMMAKYKPDESIFRECPRAKKQEKKEE